MPENICLGFLEQLCVLLGSGEFYGYNQMPPLLISAVSTQNV